MFWKTKLIKNQRAFSLLELMIAVTIIAIIGAIAIPTYVKQTTKARRSECLTMLTSLKVTEESYIADEGYSYNEVHCPKTSGLNTRTAPANKNAMTIPLAEEDRYCSAVDTTPADGFPDPYTNTNGGLKVNYQYRIKACPSSQANPIANCTAANIADGTLFPSFAGGTNKDGFTNPADPGAGVDFPTNAQLTAESLLAPDNLRRFVIECRANIDDDATVDQVLIDHLGESWIRTNDVNN